VNGQGCRFLRSARTAIRQRDDVSQIARMGDVEDVSVKGRLRINEGLYAFTARGCRFQRGWLGNWTFYIARWIHTEFVYQETIKTAFSEHRSRDRNRFQRSMGSNREVWELLSEITITTESSNLLKTIRGGYSEPGPQSGRRHYLTRVDEGEAGGKPAVCGLGKSGSRSETKRWLERRFSSQRPGLSGIDRGTERSDTGIPGWCTGISAKALFEDVSALCGARGSRDEIEPWALLGLRQTMGDIDCFDMKHG